MGRRRFSYPLSLAVVVATLIAITGGWIAWWNYRSGVDNVRSLAATLFDQVSREAAGETTAFVLRAPPAAEALAGLGPATQPELAHRFEAVLRANPSSRPRSGACTRRSLRGIRSGRRSDLAVVDH